MTGNINTEIQLDIPEGSIDVISKAKMRIKEKILVITLAEQFGKEEILHVFKTSNIEKSLKDLRKKIKIKIRSISESHLYKIDDMILSNIHNLQKEYHDDETLIHPEEKEQKLDISFEEWQKTLQEKYEILRETTLKNFSDVWQATEFALSVKNVIHIQGNTLPFIGIILGPPSSSKTLALEMLRKLEMTFYTDNFTAKSFVSHNTAVSQEQLAKIDMLPKIKDKLLITPELAPLFNGKDEDLLNILGIVTRIADGQGYESDSGAYGHRGYNEDIMFGWVGASVDIPRKVYKHLTTLGPKLYFMRMVTKKKTESDYLQMLKSNNFNSSKKEVEEKLLDYLKWFNYCPKSEFESGLIKIQCETANDDEKSLKFIIKLGELLSHLRGFAQTWETHGTQGSDYAYSTPIIEHPSRAMINLTNLARGHALSKGRLNITSDDVPIIIKTALSTAPVERVMIFDLLLNKNGKLTTTEIEEFLNVSGPTASKTMTELKVLGLVNMKKENEGQIYSPQSIILKEQFKWFLSEEFRGLRGGFVPEKFTDEEKECKEKSPPPTLKKYDDTEEDLDFEILKDTFWNSFEEIEENEKKNNPILGPILIKRVKLTNALINKTLFTVLKSSNNPIIVTGELIDKIIGKLIREGKLAEPKEGRYYRINKHTESADASASA